MTLSENTKRSPYEVGVGRRFDMGRIPGVFARVTLACVRGDALIAAVAVGLVELCCVVGSCVSVFIIAC